MRERDAYIALNMARGIGPATVACGVEFFGGAAAFFTAGAGALSRVRGISLDSAEALAREFASLDWRLEMERAQAMNTHIATLADAFYPPLLRAVRSPPPALYVAGSLDALLLPMAAVVGTRAPTPYGRANAALFASALSRAGYCVVSGLARGVDTEAHKAALAAGGATVAVVGGALDRLYPAENRALAREIATSGGAVASEQPFGRPATRQAFPMRNRVISGLSRAVLVVEAGSASGTMGTAAHALEQGRSVLAVPGRTDCPSAAGCHRLIKEGARLADCPEDLLDELSSLHFGAPPAPPASTPPPLPARPPAPPMDETESLIMRALETGEATLDALAAASGLEPRKLLPRLTSLEMKGAIQRSGPDRVKAAK